MNYFHSYIYLNIKNKTAQILHFKFRHLEICIVHVFQCKMSVNGHRGECWCVNPHTGRPIPTSPLIRGDPNCSQYFDDLEMDPSVEPQN